MSNDFLKSISSENEFNANYDLLMKGIDKSKNHLVTHTTKDGVVKKVWVSNEDHQTTQDAGNNAGKNYEKSGQRHTSHSGFDSGDEITFTAGGKTMKGTFRHVNENKHGAMAVIRGEDNKLYERAVGKISKKAKSADKPATVSKSKELAQRYKDLTDVEETKEALGLSHMDIVRHLKTTFGAKDRKEVEDALKEHGVKMHSPLSDEEKAEIKTKSTPVASKGESTTEAKSDPNTAKYMSKFTKEEHKQKAEYHTKKAEEITGGFQKDKDAKKAHLAIAASHKEHASKSDTTTKPKEEATGSADKMAKVEAIKERAILDKDLTTLKEAYKKAAPTKYDRFDEKNVGDVSALKVLIKQYKAKLKAEGVDHTKLGLKYDYSEKTAGKTTAE
jgi:hypothetical protein